MSNSEYLNIVELRRRGLGVNLSSERETTQTTVKVPKYQLSVNGKRLSITIDSEEVGLEAATL